MVFRGLDAVGSRYAQSKRDDKMTAFENASNTQKLNLIKELDPRFVITGDMDSGTLTTHYKKLLNPNN